MGELEILVNVSAVVSVDDFAIMLNNNLYSAGFNSYDLFRNGDISVSYSTEKDTLFITRGESDALSRMGDKDLPILDNNDFYLRFNSKSLLLKLDSKLFNKKSVFEYKKNIVILSPNSELGYNIYRVNKNSFSVKKNSFDVGFDISQNGIYHSSAIYDKYLVTGFNNNTRPNTPGRVNTFEFVDFIDMDNFSVVESMRITKNDLPIRKLHAITSNNASIYFVGLSKSHDINEIYEYSNFNIRKISEFTIPENILKNHDNTKVFLPSEKPLNDRVDQQYFCDDSTIYGLFEEIGSSADILGLLKHDMSTGKNMFYESESSIIVEQKVKMPISQLFDKLSNFKIGIEKKLLK